MLNNLIMFFIVLEFYLNISLLMNVLNENYLGSMVLLLNFTTTSSPTFMAPMNAVGGLTPKSVIFKVCCLQN
jgi:hypothetical protein